MIFGIAETIAFLSQGTTLERGSLIMTGTPPGIGAMRNPKVVLNHGDDMRVEIEKIGASVALFTGNEGKADVFGRYIDQRDLLRVSVCWIELQKGIGRHR